MRATRALRPQPRACLGNRLRVRRHRSVAELALGRLHRDDERRRCGHAPGVVELVRREQHRLELVLERVADRLADLECGGWIRVAAVEDAVSGLRSGEANQLGQIRNRNRVEATLASPRDGDAAAIVEGALDEIELARVLHTSAVYGAGPDEGRGQRPMEQRLLELCLVRRVRCRAGLRRRLGLEDRHGKLRRFAALPVERPTLVVGVDRGGRDDDERADEAVERVELHPMCAMHGHAVVDHVRTGADRGPQLAVVLAVGRNRLDAELLEAVGQCAGARDGHHLPAVGRQRVRRGATDQARASDQHRPRH
jgi:hypothetical protein